MHGIHGKARMLFVVPKKCFTSKMHIFHLTVVIWIQRGHCGLIKPSENCFSVSLEPNHV